MMYFSIQFNQVKIQVIPGIALKSLQPKNAESLFELVDENRKHLSDFLPWVVYNNHLKDTENFLYYCQQCHEKQNELHLGVFLEQTLAGVCSLTLNPANQRADIGYWLAEKCTKKGVMTKSVKALTDFSFQQLNLNKLTIKCDPENLASSQIAKRLGFSYEGRLREHEKHIDKFVDLLSYSLLKSEWITEQ